MGIFPWFQRKDRLLKRFKKVSKSLFYRQITTQAAVAVISHAQSFFLLFISLNGKYLVSECGDEGEKGEGEKKMKI